MPVIHKEIIKLPDLDQAGRIQFEITETIERDETRIVTIEDTENLINYHETKLNQLSIELAELTAVEVSPIPGP